MLVVGQPSLFDPSRAPEGKHTLWVQVRMAPGTIVGDAAGTITARDWDTAAAPFAERALAILEAHAPGVTDSIIARRIVTPAELEADNPNLVGGDQVCGSHHLSQNFLYRPGTRSRRRLDPGSQPAPYRRRGLARCGHRGGAGIPAGAKAGGQVTETKNHFNREQSR